MTERTFTEDEIREAIQRVTRSHPLQDDVIAELTRPKPPVIPEGVLTWGIDEWGGFSPCYSRGDGTGTDGRGRTYFTLRLTHPDDWAKAPEWAESRGIDEDGDIVWHDSKVDCMLVKRDVVYAEGRPNE